MPALPNAQHEKFVQELIRGKSHADAYLAAGYKAKRRPWRPQRRRAF